MGHKAHLDTLVLDTSEILPLLVESCLGGQGCAIKHISGVLVIEVDYKVEPVLEKAYVKSEVVLISGFPLESGICRRRRCHTHNFGSV